MAVPFKPIWGKESALPNVAVKGNVYFTIDTGKIFLDISNRIEERKLLYASQYDINMEEETLVIDKGENG